jgi:hypothetical protein
MRVSSIIKKRIGWTSKPVGGINQAFGRIRGRLEKERSLSRSFSGKKYQPGQNKIAANET